MSLALLFSPPLEGETLKLKPLVIWSDINILVHEKEHLFIKDFIKPYIKNLPRYIQKRLITAFAKYHTIAKETGNERAPYLGLMRASKPYQDILKKSPFNDHTALFREKVLESEARLFADNCVKVAAGYQLTDCLETNLRSLAGDLFAFVDSKGLAVPFKGNDLASIESAILRMQCDKWWLRKLRRARDQLNEFFAIAAGLIGKGKNEYCSNQCTADYRQQQQANWDYLASMELVDDETGEAFNLKEIAKATAANPENRRVELMIRIRGLEELAKESGYTAHLLTITAPSKYHKTSRKWNGCNPAKTQAYLCEQWAKSRAKIARECIDWFGVRVAEPHASSTPHWHMLVFCHPKHFPLVKSIIKGFALEHDAHERGAKDKRFDCVYVDPAKGSAVGYIAKYISKNINAAKIGCDEDYDGTGTLQDAAIRVVAWASRWRIRQFQFFGAAKISVWREFRRIKEPLDNPKLEAVRVAAGLQGSTIKPDWAKFSTLVKCHNVSFEYEDNGINEYNEPVKVVKGLLVDGVEMLTRSVKWIVRKVRAAHKGATSPATWSTVTNCTHLKSASVKSDIQNSVDSSSWLQKAELALKNIGLCPSLIFRL